MVNASLCSLEALDPLEILAESRISEAPEVDQELPQCNDLIVKQQMLADLLESFLPGDKQEFLFELIRVLDEINGIESKIYYRQGVRDGFHLAKEMLEKGA